MAQEGNPFLIDIPDRSQDVNNILQGIMAFKQKREMDSVKSREQAWRDNQAQALGFSNEADMMSQTQGNATGQPMNPMAQEQGIPMESGQAMPQDMAQPDGMQQPQTSTVNPRLKLAMTPQVARQEREVLTEIGIDTPEKQRDVMTFAEQVDKVPDDELQGVILNRVKMGVEQGRDMSHTASLLAMPPEEARKTINTANLIVNQEAIRRMYAMNPDATKRFLSSNEEMTKTPRETDLSVRLREFEDWKDMPEGTQKERDDKRARGMILGAIQKSASTEEKVDLATQIEDIKTKEQEKRDKSKSQVNVAEARQIEGIKTNEEILREMRKQTETPEGMLKLAKLNAENIQARANEEAKAYEAQDSLDLIDTLESGDLNRIYGRGESVYPVLLRSQKGIDMLVNRERLVATIKMAGRGQLKGQGSVSDSDAKMLADSATILGNPNISGESARKELARVKEALKRSMGAASQSSEALGGSAPPSQAETIEQRLARLRGQK